MFFTSSTSVYAQTDGAWVDENVAGRTDARNRQDLAGNRRDRPRAGGIVARVAGIYGPGRSLLLRKFLAGEAVIDRERDRFLNQVHRDDIASALLLADSTDLGVAADLQRRRRSADVVSECYAWLATRTESPAASVGEQTAEIASAATATSA